MDVAPNLKPTRRDGKKMTISRRNHCQADARTRTGDPFITSEVLYQLSYVGGRRMASLPRCQKGPSGWSGAPVRVRHSSTRIAHRSWSRQRPPIFR